mgnify:CR=1 FL=1
MEPPTHLAVSLYLVAVPEYTPEVVTLVTVITEFSNVAAIPEFYIEKDTLRDVTYDIPVTEFEKDTAAPPLTEYVSLR